MNTKSLISILFLLPLLFFSSWLAAETYEFTIDQGEVVVTQSFCPPESCFVELGQLRGSFVAEIREGDIRLSDILVKSEVLGFELPANPNEDSGGTRREAKFDFDGQTLNIEGVVDERAFDGPLFEYQIQAFVSSIPVEGFDPQGFFTARQDFRRCAAPMCGGLYISAVNQFRMRCPDGSRAKECYVGTIDWGKLQSSPFKGDELLLIQGDLSKGPELAGEYGLLAVKNAYRGVVDGRSWGFYAGIVNNGIVCITSPCFSYDEFILNRDWQLALSGIDLESSGADRESIRKAYDVLAEGGALIAKGYNRPTWEQTGRGRAFKASNFYLPILPEEKDVTLCPSGYMETDMGCATRHGCFYPQVELITQGGAAMVDPVTGEITSSESYSCVDTCEFPAEPLSDGYCLLQAP